MQTRLDFSAPPPQTLENIIFERAFPSVDQAMTHPAVIEYLRGIEAELASGKTEVHRLNRKTLFLKVWREAAVGFNARPGERVYQTLDEKQHSRLTQIVEVVHLKMRNLIEKATAPPTSDEATHSSHIPSPCLVEWETPFATGHAVASVSPSPHLSIPPTRISGIGPLRRLMGSFRYSNMSFPGVVQNDMSILVQSPETYPLGSPYRGHWEYPELALNPYGTLFEGIMIDMEIVVPFLAQTALPTVLSGRDSMNSSRDETSLDQEETSTNIGNGSVKGSHHGADGRRC
ncbi:hypothetical protein BDP27DRAFT_1364812 [Rhodocollybia butyracea]|uniref:Uncharacterized protein n=1 Tax=Rhodocollybia butyracea TaxID=206335 RepID=A0A9P5PQN1_9AGAR|nr:hypothetical protein BDP27DRAFT_1364812 [Rhodocollybia butyracea]